MTNSRKYNEMRKILVVLFVFVAAVAVSYGQANVDYRSLAKKLAKSDENIVNEKKSQKIGTWMDRGELLVEIFNAYQGNMTYGMEVATFSLLMGGAVGEREEEFNGQQCHVVETERVDYYFVDGKYKFFKVTKPLLDDALQTALVAYKTAISLDPERKKEKQIGKSLLMLRNAFTNEGLNYHNAADFGRSVQSFESAIVVDSLATSPTYEKDATLYYSLGFVQAANKQYKEAFANYEKSESLGNMMEGQLLCLMAEVALQDTTLLPVMFEKLRTGLTQYPAQKCIQGDLIEVSIRIGRDLNEIVGYLKDAISKDENNATYYGVLGDIYERMNRFEDAEVNYLKAFSLNPEWIDVYYAYALSPYNQAITIQKEAMNLPKGRDADYDVMLADANKKWHEAIIRLEELLKKKSDYVDAMDVLKQLYFRFRMEDGMQAKYDAIQKRMEELGH